MEFWIGLVCVCLIFLFIEPLILNPYKKYLNGVLVTLLFLISALRLDIGNDYGQYVNMFYGINNTSFENAISSIVTEPSFVLIATYLYDNGFSYQMLFLIYSLFTYAILWYGIGLYSKNSTFRLLAIILYALNLHFMWYSYSIIRQALAMSIFLCAMKYIEERKLIKYMGCILFATFWHSSAIFLLILYFVPNKKIAVKWYIPLLAFAFVIAKTNILLPLVINFLQALGIAYVGYLQTMNVDSFKMGMFPIFMILISVLCMRFVEEKNSRIMNIFCLYNGIYILFGFSGPLLRMSLYFETSILIILPQVIMGLKKRYNENLIYIMIYIPLALTLLNTIMSVQNDQDGLLNPLRSTTNIDYQINTNLFGE